jgi:sugar lactone lactonase YvrE
MLTSFPRCHFAIAASCLTLALGGCASNGNASLRTEVLTAQVSAANLAIEGRAMVPQALISNNGSGLISNNGSGIIASNSSRFGLLAVADAPLANALGYLTTPDEDFYRFNGKAITTTSDASGKYRFQGGVPRKQPVVVSFVLPGNRRVVGFTVPESGTSKLDLSLATTFVTEYLREQAARARRSMADYDLARLPDLAKRTTAALDAGELPTPDLVVGHIQDLNQAYALAVGENHQGLGDAWAKLLGSRALATTTAAGSGVTDSGGDGKPAIQGEFYRLKGVAVDHEGNVFLADEGNHRVRRIDAKTGLLSTVAGTGDRGFGGDGGPATQAQLSFPRAVLLDRTENLYVFDSQNCRIRRVDKATGVITTFAGAPTPNGAFWTGGHDGDGGPATQAKLFSPRGGAFDSQGNLYVTDGLKDTTFHTIRKITPTGEISTFAGSADEPASFSGENVLAEKARFNYTNQLFCTPDDQLYVADTNNHCVRKIDLATRLVTTVAGLGGKKADSPEADGKLAVETRLNAPYGVAVDGKGQVFISERGFHRLLVVKPDGRLYTLGGGGSLTGDGDARLLALSEPHDLAFDTDGSLLLADARASKLRRFLIQFGL